MGAQSPHPGLAAARLASQLKPAPTSVLQYLTAEQEKAALGQYEEANRTVDTAQNSGYPRRSPRPREHPATLDLIFHHRSASRRVGANHGAFFGGEAEEGIQDPGRRCAGSTAESTSAAAYVARLPSLHRSMHPRAPVSTRALWRSRHCEGTSRRGIMIWLLRRTTHLSLCCPARAAAHPQVARRPLPLRSTSQRSTHIPPTQRPQPSSMRVLTATEEKAKYEAHDEGRKLASANPTTNGGASTAANGATAGTPPLLFPRRPADYIKEAQEKDAQLSRLKEDVPGLTGTPKKLNWSSSLASLSSCPLAEVAVASWASSWVWVWRYCHSRPAALVAA